MERERENEKERERVREGERKLGENSSVQDKGLTCLVRDDVTFSNGSVIVNYVMQLTLPVSVQDQVGGVLKWSFFKYEIANCNFKLRNIFQGSVSVNQAMQLSVLSRTKLRCF